MFATAISKFEDARLIRARARCLRTLWARRFSHGISNSHRAEQQLICTRAFSSSAAAATARTRKHVVRTENDQDNENSDLQFVRINSDDWRFNAPQKKSNGVPNEYIKSGGRVFVRDSTTSVTHSKTSIDATKSSDKSRVVSGKVYPTGSRYTPGSGPGIRWDSGSLLRKPNITSTADKRSDMLTGRSSNSNTIANTANSRDDLSNSGWTIGGVVDSNTSMDDDDTLVYNVISPDKNRLYLNWSATEFFFGEAITPSPSVANDPDCHEDSMETIGDPVLSAVNKNFSSGGSSSSSSSSSSRGGSGGDRGFSSSSGGSDGDDFDDSFLTSHDGTFHELDPAKAPRRIKNAKTISEARLEELLNAEIVSLGLRNPTPFTIHEILSYKNTEELGKVLITELPVRYAHRIKLIQSIPKWHSSDQLRMVRNLYVQSFKDLRSFIDSVEYLGEDSIGHTMSASTATTASSSAIQIKPTIMKQLHESIVKIRDRHKHTVRLIRGCASLDLPLEDTNEILEKFFVGRISTNLLIQRFLELAEPENPKFIDEHCDPMAVCEAAAKSCTSLANKTYGVNPCFEITSKSSERIQFPYPRLHLHFVLFELLKNSARATIQAYGHHGQEEVNKRPIKVTITGDSQSCGIRVRDEGGGIAVHKIPLIWSYLQSTAESDDQADRRVDDVITDEEIMRYASESISESRHISFAGGGCGLPLSALYCRYLGGGLELHSIPNHGTDVFMFLNRITSSQAEKMPTGDEMTIEGGGGGGLGGGSGGYGGGGSGGNSKDRSGGSKDRGFNTINGSINGMGSLDRTSFQNYMSGR